VLTLLAVIVLPLTGLVASTPATVQAYSPSISYGDFSSTAGLALNGSASTAAILGSTALRLTPASLQQRGSAYSTTLIDSTSSFHTQFQFYLHNTSADATDGTADGFTFVVQNDSRGTAALGDPGGNLGYGAGNGYTDSAIPVSPSVAVAFNTFFAANKPALSVLTNGDAYTYPVFVNPGFSFYSTDTSTRYAWIEYDAPTHLLSVFVSMGATKPATPALTYTYDIAGKLGATAYVGFTGGTGAGDMAQDILNWHFSSVPTLDVLTDGSWTVDPSQTAHLASLVRLDCLNSQWDASPGLEPARWIWASPCSISTGEQHTFTKTFTLNGDVTSATLSILIDNYGSVTINGTQVLSFPAASNPQLFGTPTTADVGQYLHRGVNEVDIVVANYGSSGDFSSNPAGLRALISIGLTNVAPTSSITFPAAGSVVGPSGWSAGCSNLQIAGICGTASVYPGGNPVAGVFVSIESVNGHTPMYWDGSGFNTATVWWNPATLDPSTLASSGTVSWHYDTQGLPLSKLPDGGYVIGSIAYDTNGDLESLATGVSVQVGSNTCGSGNGLGGNGLGGNGLGGCDAIIPNSGNGLGGNGLGGNGLGGNGLGGNGMGGNGLGGAGCLSGNGLGGNGLGGNGLGGNGLGGNGLGGNGLGGNGLGGNGLGGFATCNVETVGIRSAPPTATVEVGGQSSDSTHTTFANVDPGSTIHIVFDEPVALASAASGIVLSPGSYHAVCDTTCSGAQIAPPAGGFPQSTTFTLTVTGLTDATGNVAGTQTFALTTSAGAPTVATDSDGDGIPDSWDGGQVGSTGINTANWGFTANHRDLCLVEDWMDGQGLPGTYDQQISQQANQDIVTAFANADIHLVIFEGPNSVGVTDPGYGRAIPYTAALGGLAADGSYDFTAFDLLKQQYFPPALSQLCHFAIIAHSLGGSTATGASRGIGSSDMVVALGAAGTGRDASNCTGACVGVGTEMEMAGTVMHELGHGLGLFHGGNEDVNYKPNYPSVMNYAFQFSGVPENGHWVVDYSRGQLNSIVENSLSETGGLPQPTGAGAIQYGTAHVCASGGATVVVEQVNAMSNVNWNCDTGQGGADVIEPGTVTYDVNGDGQLGTLTDFNDWANLKFTAASSTIGLGAKLLPTTSTVDASTVQNPDGPNALGTVAHTFTPTVTPSAPNLIYGQTNVALTASVAAGSPAATANEGGVSFQLSQGGTNVGLPVAANVSNGLASANYTLPAGSVGQFTIKATYTDSASPPTFNGSSGTGAVSVLYEPAGTTCDGSPGHAVLQPVNSDGTSVFKQGSTVPVKFRVCDYKGGSVGPTASVASVVTSFKVIKAAANCGGCSVDETIVSTTPDTAFRWDSTNQQWIFNLSSKNLQAGTTYTYEITLNDGTPIDFSFATK
jgi:hypothetical protein